MITLSRFPGALEGWVEHNLACADYTYGLHMPWVPVGLNDADQRARHNIPTITQVVL